MRTDAIATLHMARVIANAVIRADTLGHGRHRDSTQDVPTQAVLRMLRRQRWWLFPVPDDDDAITPPPWR